MSVGQAGCYLLSVPSFYCWVYLCTTLIRFSAPPTPFTTAPNPALDLNYCRILVASVLRGTAVRPSAIKCPAKQPNQ